MDGSALYHVITWGLVALMFVGHFMYPSGNSTSEQSPPAFLPYLPLVLIGVGVAWTLFAPQSRKLRFVLPPVYAASMGAYYMLGPWWGMGVSQGGSYLVQRHPLHDRAARVGAQALEVAGGQCCPPVDCGAMTHAIRGDRPPGLSAEHLGLPQ